MCKRARERWGRGHAEYLYAWDVVESSGSHASLVVSVRTTHWTCSIALPWFFFSSRRRHTILQGYWSSDVCSSDLTGARDSYFGHNDWAQFAPGLKSIVQATSIRRKILLAFEMAERETDPEKRKGLLTFVLVRSEERRVGKECRSRW